MNLSSSICLRPVMFYTTLIIPSNDATPTERRSVRPRIKSGVNCYACSTVLLNDEQGMATGDAQCFAARIIRSAYRA
jgi:predicted transcriptional regulator